MRLCLIDSLTPWLLHVSCSKTPGIWAWLQVYDQCARVAQLVLKENGLAERVKVETSGKPRARSQKSLPFVPPGWFARHAWSWMQFRMGMYFFLHFSWFFFITSLMLRSGRWWTRSQAIWKRLSCNTLAPWSFKWFQLANWTTRALLTWHGFCTACFTDVSHFKISARLERICPRRLTSVFSNSLTPSCSGSCRAGMGGTVDSWHFMTCTLRTTSISFSQDAWLTLHSIRFVETLGRNTGHTQTLRPQQSKPRFIIQNFNEFYYFMQQIGLLASHFNHCTILVANSINAIVTLSREFWGEHHSHFEGRSGGSDSVLDSAIWLIPSPNV